ncbi:MAG: alpha/beta fold hydrolase [Kineosporiaceae bacterium]
MTGTGGHRFVLLHGLAGSPAMWRPVAALLAPHGPVTVPELPWNGTASAEWAHTGGQADALAGCYGPGDIVVAHSYAATLLLGRLARGEGPAPRATVLVSPFYRPRPRDFTWATLGHYMHDFHLLLAEGVRAASQRQVPDDLLRDMAVSVRDRIGPYGWIRFFETYLASATWDLAAVPGPVGLVHGEDDEVVEAGSSRDLHERLTGSTVRLLAGAAHFPMLLAPAELAEEITRTAARAPHVHPVPEPSQEVPA